MHDPPCPCTCVALDRGFAKRTDEQWRPLRDSRIFSLKARSSECPTVQTPTKGSLAQRVQG